jgi:RNA polymerase sigma-70 factor, ECF subfamily
MDAFAQPVERQMPGHVARRIAERFVARGQAGSTAMTDTRATDVRLEIESLFNLHHGEIYAYLMRMVRDSELAADMAQDTFVKAYRAYDSLEDRAHARAWLYQIAHRVALDEFRRRRIVRFLPWTGESHGAAPSAEHVALEGRFSGEMERALRRMPERQRSALILAEIHDLTGVELAAALGVSHIAARALLTRARESLRQALAIERAAEASAEAGAEQALHGTAGAPGARGAADRAPDSHDDNGASDS